MNSIKIDSLLEENLFRLGMNKEVITNYETLDTGRSGATLLKLHTKKEQYILKFTSSHATRDLYGNAQREFLFYKQISPFVNVQIPKIISLFEEEDYGIGLLMSVYQPTPSPVNWDDELAIKAITQMASIHAQFWNNMNDFEQKLGTEFLHKLEPAMEYEINNSVKKWQEVYPVSVKPEYCSVSLDTISQLLCNLNNLLVIESELPSTMVHGDFHMENCLIDKSGEIKIADWQMPGLGSGPTDIGFFLARSELSGSDISTDKILYAYCKELNSRLAESIRISTVERIVHSRKLFIHLLWSPHFLKYNPESSLYKVLNGIVESSRKLCLIN